jgi:hypothetical protein
MRFSSAIKKLKNSFGNGASCGPFSGQKTIRLPAISHILSQGHTTNKRNIGFRARMHFLNGLTNWYPPRGLFEIRANCRQELQNWKATARAIRR